MTKEDWESAPASVRRMVKWLLENFEERLSDLEEDKMSSDIEDHQASAHATYSSALADEPKKMCCSFCGRTEADGLRLATGAAASICRECVEICNELLAETSSQE